MNTCADFHPDPDYDDEDVMDDRFDETAPGATGWITAENMDQYMDEDGNFAGTVIGGGSELGPGAGTVRTRGDGEAEANGTNGADGEEHEGKYQRTG
jgi:nucleotide-sensitive chloride channel 1A